MDSKRFQRLIIIVWFVKLINFLCSKIQNGDAKAMDIAIRYEPMTGATLHGTHLQENKDAVQDSQSRHNQTGSRDTWTRQPSPHKN